MDKPIKPNIQIPEHFALNGVKTDFTNEKLQNGYDRLQPDVLPGDCLNKFIDDTYKGLNYAIAGTDAINSIKQGEILTTNDNNELISESVDNLITDSFVSKSGDTMTGNLTVIQEAISPHIDTQRLDYSIAKTVAPTSNTYLGSYNAYDKDGKSAGCFRVRHSTNNIYQAQMLVVREVNDSNIEKNFTVGIDANGKVQYSPVQLITTYVSGTSGYNIWSNGYCEQWGRHSSGTITFLKKFANSNYVALTTQSADVSRTINVRIISKTTTSMKIVSEDTCDWKAYGYLASDQY